MLQEAITSAASQISESQVDSLMVELLHRLQDATEILSAIIIGVGVAMAACQLVRLLWTARRQSNRDRRRSYQGIRLGLSRFLAMALEFQLAADLLATTQAPSWDQLGRLGVIAVIRTFLNFFLAREIEVEDASARTIARPAEAA